MIESTATQEVELEGEGEGCVAAREQLLASIPEGVELLHVRRDSWAAAVPCDFHAEADAPAG